MSFGLVPRRLILGSLSLAGVRGLTGCGTLQIGPSPMQPFDGVTESAILRVTHDSFDVGHPRQHATLRSAGGERLARYSMAGDFGKRIVLERHENTAVVGQQFDVRVESERLGAPNKAKPSARARGRVIYSRLDRWEMERHQPEGRGVLEESSGARVPIHFDFSIVTLGYPAAPMQIWLQHFHREYQVLSEGVSVLYACVNYSYYAFGKREFHVIRSADAPDQLELRAMQAFLIAKLIVGD